MESVRLRFITLAVVTAAFVVTLTTPAALAGGIQDNVWRGAAFPDPVVQGSCEAPGPVAQAIAWARCQWDVTWRVVVAYVCTMGGACV